MHVIIATAEPRGAYHLTPLKEALASNTASFTHLMPYPEPVQGEPATAVSSRVSLLEECDRVVITGGCYSAWTELVARHAIAHSKPIIFSELASVPLALTSPVPATALELVTALSQDGADNLARYLGTPVADVQITGTPQLDNLPSWQPRQGHALLLSTVRMTDHDPDYQLVTLGHMLESDGWEVRVRLHPREDAGPWAGFEIVAGETQVESAASASVVIGYPGSAHILAAAVGVPTVTFSPNANMVGHFSARHHAAMSHHATSAVEVLQAISGLQPPLRYKVEECVGPIGGAAQRLVDLWSAPIAGTPLVH